MRPELINRLCGIVQFDFLEPLHIREIVDKEIDLLNQRMIDRNVVVPQSAARAASTRRSRGALCWSKEPWTYAVVRNAPNLAQNLSNLVHS